MKPTIKLGRVLGIEIGLHYTWFIIALLITFSLAEHFSEMHPDWGLVTIWGLSLTTAVLFFVSVIVHEISHALVAKGYMIPVESITLFALGGVASIRKEASKPQAEFWMGIVGPITSAVIGVLCLVTAALLGWKFTVVMASPVVSGLVWLGSINIMLAAFNMIPGFPLDGGRVLRAIIWWMTDDFDKSMRISTGIGQFVAFTFIIFGLWQLLMHASFGGLWIVLIGWFLAQAAEGTYLQHQFLTSLRGLKAENLMEPGGPLVTESTSVSNFVHESLLKTWHRCFLVTDGTGSIKGLITPHEIKNLDKDKWQTTTIAEVMMPVDKMHTVSPNSTAVSAAELMSQEDVNQLPVVSDGQLLGVINRGNLIQALQIRSELHE